MRLVLLTCLALALVACGGDPFESALAQEPSPVQEQPLPRLPNGDALLRTRANADAGIDAGEIHKDAEAEEASVADAATLDAAPEAAPEAAPTCTPFQPNTAWSNPCSAGSLPVPQSTVAWSAGACIAVEPTPAECRCVETYNCNCILPRVTFCAHPASCSGGNGSIPIVTCN